MLFTKPSSKLQVKDNYCLRTIYIDSSESKFETYKTYIAAYLKTETRLII